MFDLIGGEKLCQQQIADIRDFDTFEKAILEFQPDIIFHLAAQPLVIDSYKDPANTITTNVVGTFLLAEILRTHKLSIPTVVVTTDKVYRNEEYGHPFLESDALGGKDIYSGSKSAAEILTYSYAYSFDFLRLVTARAGNVIGGGDFSPNRIIPDIVRSIQTNQVLKLRSPQSVRPWQHVLESLNGYLLLGDAMMTNKQLEAAYNFGSDPSDYHTVGELVQLCESHLGINIPVNIENTTAIKEANLLRLDSTKALEQLNWHPKWNTHLAVGKTLNWYLKPNNEKLAITKTQITEYFS